MKINNNFYLIKISPWPLIMTLNLFLILMNLIFLMMNLNNNILINLINLNLILILWLNNSNMEKILMGFKSLYVNLSMKIMLILFIMSELMFFLSFFYINYSNLMFNNMNFNFKTYLNIFKLNFIMSFLNLMILLMSSISFMISMKKFYMKSIKSLNYLKMTIFLSIYFISIQLFEYSYMNFNFSNSIFFSNFYLLTFFHMMHVIMGMLYMIYIYSFFLLYFNNMIKSMLMCWYWHFIDLIWIMIFFIIYYFINMYML